MAQIQKTAPLGTACRNLPTGSKVLRLHDVNESTYYLFIIIIFVDMLPVTET